MKRMMVWVAAVVAMCSSTAYAQKHNVKLPTQGTWSTELQFNPFDQNGKQFKLDALKLRYFLTDKDALRLSVGLQFNKNNAWDLNQYQEPETDDSQLDKDFFEYRKDNEKNTTKSGSFTLDLGYERHFLKTGRIDLYAGGEIGIGTGWSKGDLVTASYEEAKEHEGIDPEKSSTYRFYTKEREVKGGDDAAYFKVHAAAFTGIDFYVYKGLYVGAEISFGLNNYSYKDKEVTETTNSIYVDDKDRTKEENYANNKSGLDLGFKVTPTFRLGWSF